MCLPSQYFFFAVSAGTIGQLLAPETVKLIHCAPDRVLSVFQETGRWMGRKQVREGGWQCGTFVCECRTSTPLINYPLGLVDKHRPLW